MPTKISIRENSFDTKIIGYCKESPKEVLERLIEEYIICYYLDKVCIPVENYGLETRNPSIIIEEIIVRKQHHNSLPYGLKVVGTFSQLFENKKQIFNKAKYSNYRLNFELYRLESGLMQTHEALTSFIKEYDDGKYSVSLQRVYHLRGKIYKDLADILRKLENKYCVEGQ